MGRSPYNQDRDKTPWGELPLIGSSIKEYIKTFATEKMKLNVQMTKLRMLPPQDIFQAWLYYKYIVREAAPNPEDYFLEQYNWWTSQPTPPQAMDPNNGLPPPQNQQPGGRLPPQAIPKPGSTNRGGILNTGLAPVQNPIPTQRQERVERDTQIVQQDVNNDPNAAVTTTSVSPETAVAIRNQQQSMMQYALDLTTTTSNALSHAFNRALTSVGLSTPSETPEEKRKRLRQALMTRQGIKKKP